MTSRNIILSGQDLQGIVLSGRDLGGTAPRKVIVVPGRMVNIVA